MQYRVNPKNADKISALAFGCMRFQKDLTEVEKQVRYAIEQGVNYFDTAYTYGKTEEMLGEILAKDDLRSQVKIATKLSHYLIKSREGLDKYFNTQKKRLQTDYIDYYMVHILPNVASWNFLLGIGILDWVAEKKKSGEIGQFGFSFHGACEDFCALIDAYDWDFTMIQYNYYDIHYQAGQKGLLYAAEKGIPVMVMEPLRGGMLVNQIPKSAEEIWANADSKRSVAAWAFAWVLNHPQVLTVLSGMETMEIIQENIKTANEAKADSLSAEELALFDRARAEIKATTKVDCTACNYCMPCPVGIDIPQCLQSLNDTVLLGKNRARFWYVATTEGKNASKCIKCGKCTPLCPQNISIEEKLTEVKKTLEGPIYRVMRFVARRMLNIKSKSA